MCNTATNKDRREHRRKGKQLWFAMTALNIAGLESLITGDDKHAGCFAPDSEMPDETIQEMSMFNSPEVKHVYCHLFSSLLNKHALSFKL